MVKLILRQMLLVAVRLLTLLWMLATIAVHLRTIRRARAILLYPDYGFGHTISGPDWLRRLHPGEANLTFFGTSYDKGRHNRLIRELWGAKSFIWIRTGIVLPRFGAIYDPAWSESLFRALRQFLAWCVPNALCYFWVDDLLAATSRPAWLSADSPFNERYESRYYPLMRARPAPALHVGKTIQHRVRQALTNRFGSDFSRRCAFYVRYRGFPNGEDTSSLNRLSPELGAYLPAIQVLNRAGYQVLLTGDTLAPADMVTAMAGGLVDWRAAGVDEDSFKLFAGTEVDLHVGSLSGGSSYLFVTDIPGLMLNAFAPGDALPRTTVSYKWLFEDDGIIVPLEDLLGGRFYNHQLHGCHMIDNSPQEMADTVEDFIKHANVRTYGVDPVDIGIEAPWIRAANGRISPIWLRNYYRRAEAQMARMAI